MGSATLSELTGAATEAIGSFASGAVGLDEEEIGVATDAIGSFASGAVVVTVVVVVVVVETVVEGSSELAIGTSLDL